MARAKRPGTDTEAMNFVAEFPPETAAIIEVLREVVRASIPQFKEIVYHGALGYTPSGSPWDRIVYILPASRHVTLGFFFGSHLKDPGSLLEGEGARMRHVKVRAVGEAGSPALKRLVEDAGADASKSLEALHKKSAIKVTLR